MPKHVPSFVNAELLRVLAAMAHGEELAVVDRNFLAYSVAHETQSDKLITLDGMDAPTSIGGILELMPPGARDQRKTVETADSELAYLPQAAFFKVSVLVFSELPRRVF